MLAWFCLCLLLEVWAWLLEAAVVALSAIVLDFGVDGLGGWIRGLVR